MEKLTFEEAMKKLEDITKELESNELTLDDSVKKFNEGIEMSKYCSKLLEDAEKTISVLVSNKDGVLLEENFDINNTDE